MSVCVKENIEVKIWTWQVWGKKEDSENCSWLHHRTHKEPQRGDLINKSVLIGIIFKKVK